MLCHRAFLAGFALLAASSAQAESQFCLELARHELFDKFAGSQFFNGYSTIKKSLCSSHRASNNSSLNGSANYKGTPFSLNKSDSDQVADLMCKDDYSENKLLSSSNVIYSVLSKNALEAIKACASDSNLKLKTEYADNEDLFSVAVRWTGRDEAHFNNPTKFVGAITCTGRLASVAEDQAFHNGFVSMSCVRDANARKRTVTGPNGPVVITEGGTVNVSTDEGDLLVTLPKKVETTPCPHNYVRLNGPELENLCHGCLSDYPNLYTDSGESSGTNNIRKMEYEFSTNSCGAYSIQVHYLPVAPDSRAVEIIYDNNSLGDHLQDSDVGDKVEDIEIQVSPGRHTIELTRAESFPSVRFVKIVPR